MKTITSPSVAWGCNHRRMGNDSPHNFLLDESVFVKATLDANWSAPNSPALVVYELFAILAHGIIKDSSGVVLTAFLAILRLAVAADLAMYVFMEPQLWIQVAGMLLLGVQAVLSVFFFPLQATVIALLALSLAPIEWSYDWVFKPLHYVQPLAPVEPTKDTI
ncbi:hypothetical protein PSACC_00629 [Paramicrosporidium saccamoebae]|uniref:Uncharacterized protein n=1 Tax=Paramicrosporidium saccamoebae TaxID=1246581 RepID=A0A2H9TP76_9FUNG|nr:hypothetical protein PSACC_00629 [Paramicrosporidium saccamoebae]